MTVKYALRQNPLVEDPDIYSAQVKSNGTVDLDGIAKRMIELGSTVTTADILAVLEDAIRASESLLLDGFRVHIDGLCELFPRIKGNFEGLTDSFDPARHSVHVGARPGVRIRRAFSEQVSLAKQETVTPVPSLLNFVDTGSGTTNEQISTGNIGTINGHRLSFDIDRPDEGIFFVAADAGVIRVDAVGRNMPKQLVFLTPEGLSSQKNPYRLQVRARLNGNEDLRVGELACGLTAVS